MHLRKLAATLAAALILTAAAPGLPVLAATDSNTPPVGVTVEGGLRLEAGPVAAIYNRGETAQVEASVTNTTGMPLTYWLPTPCDPLFRISMTGADGNPILLLREDEVGKEPMACIQVIRNLTIEAGGAIAERFEIPLSPHLVPGTHTVTIHFLARSWEDGTTPSVSFPLMVGTKTESQDSSVTGPGTGDTPLPDAASHWASAQVQQAMELGFVIGYPDGTFRPDHPVTRAELTKMLVSALGLKSHTSSVTTFADATGHWAQQSGYVEAAVEAALLQPGDFGAQFGADTHVTREEVVRMLVRSLGLEAAALKTSGSDLLPADQAEMALGAGGYLVLARSLGIIQGYGDGTLQVRRPVTRAEAIVMILRSLAAGEVKLQSDSSLQVNGQLLLHPGLAVLERDPRLVRAPLSVVAAATGILTVEEADGWLLLIHGAHQLRIKESIPYGVDRHGSRVPLDGGMPLRVDGDLFVSAGTLQALGFTAQYSADLKRFQIDEH